MNKKEASQLEAKVKKVASSGKVINTDDTVIKALMTTILAYCLTKMEVLEYVMMHITSDMITDKGQSFVYDTVRLLYDEGKEVNTHTVGKRMELLDAERFKEMGGIKGVVSTDDLMYADNSEECKECVDKLTRIWIGRWQVDMLQTAISMVGDPEGMRNYVMDNLMELEKKRALGGIAKSLYECLDEMISGYKKQKETGEDMSVKTGIAPYDEVMGGLIKAQLTVLAGRPGHGKSAIALLIAVNAALEGKKVCFFSLEMTRWQLMLRIVPRFCDILGECLRDFKVSPQDIKVMEALRERLKDLPLYFYDVNQCSTVDKIRATVNMQLRGSGCDLVIIDHLHRFSEGSRSENETVRIGNLARAIKTLAATANAPVLLLSQLNRQSENRTDDKQEGETKYQLSDLRDSGVIEQEADNVVFVHPSHPIEGKDYRDITLQIAKSRCGKIGNVCFRCSKDFTRIYDKTNNKQSNI